LSTLGVVLRGVVARGDDLTAAAQGVDVVIIATPDGAVAQVAAAIAPVPGTVVLHMSGALGLDVLAPHARRASLHPLMPLPSAEVGRVRLQQRDHLRRGRRSPGHHPGPGSRGAVVEIDDDHRAAYHAAACIAANHLVALLGQVERVAASAGLDVDAFLSPGRAALTTWPTGPGRGSDRPGRPG
jgi:predicted short-subunit dehydrogenase-like oxidoreductase (DUF2520 family)